MSELQMKITMGGADIFLQGEGELVYRIFKELREEGLGALYNGQAQSAPPNTYIAEESKIDSTEAEEQPNSDKKPAKSRKKNNIKQPQLLKDLDLSGKGVGKSLKDFVAEKNPTSNIERTAVFVYYLENILKIPEITPDHIFSCYRDINLRLSKNILQNISDTARKNYGYIQKNNGKCTMSILGTNLVEHDLPKTKE